MTTGEDQPQPIVFHTFRVGPRRRILDGHVQPAPLVLQRIEPLAPARVRFTQREKFNGILVPFFNFDSTRRSFESLNQALKTRAEASQTP
jgi:hypothetical protein